MIVVTRRSRRPAAAIAPVNVDPPLIIAVAGGEITVWPGEWRAFPAPSFSYQWLASGEPIPDAAGVFLPAGAGGYGVPITVSVTASNPAGSATVISAPVTLEAPNEGLPYVLPFVLAGLGVGMPYDLPFALE